MSGSTTGRQALRDGVTYWPSPGPRGPATLLAENSLYGLDVRRSDYRSLSRHRAERSHGRHLPDADVRHGNAVVDAVATVEVFTGNRLRLLDPLVTEDDVFSWPKREKAWRKRCVELEDSGEIWLALKGFIQVRNALQHGLGRLTDFQLAPLRRTEILDSIRAAGCLLEGDRVRLRFDDVESCFDVCAAFVVWLDRTGAAPD
jgi:hypothetical protein